jgi:hypothetical protein
VYVPVKVSPSVEVPEMDTDEAIGAPVLLIWLVAPERTGEPVPESDAGVTWNRRYCPMSADWSVYVSLAAPTICV